MSIQQRCFGLCFVWSLVFITQNIFIKFPFSNSVAIIALITLFIISLILIFSLKDSPGNMILFGRESLGFGILSKILGRELDLLEVNNITQELNETSLTYSLRYLFKSAYIRTTILSTIIIVLNQTIIFGISLIIIHLEIEGDNLIFLIINIPLVFVLFSEVLGRKIGILIMIGLGLLSLILGVCIGSLFFLYLALYFIIFIEPMISVYICEIYHTKMRSVGISFVIGFGYIFGYILTILLRNIFQSYAFLIILFACCLIDMACIFGLKYETNKQPLDKNYEN
jgi:hypothetical protein